MSSQEEKEEGGRRFVEGRALRPFKGHLKGEPGFQVLAVELKRNNAGDPVPGEPSVLVPTVVALNTMPQVSVWERIGGTGEDSWMFAHRESYDAEWDTEARRWVVVGVNPRESRGWPAFAPRKWNPGQPEAEHDHGGRGQQQPQQPATWASTPTRPAPRRRRTTS